jgi:hypothetical protein
MVRTNAPIITNNVRFLDQVSLASFDGNTSTIDVAIFNYLALNNVVKANNVTGSFTAYNPDGSVNGTSIATINNFNTSSVPTGITDTGVMKFNFYVNGLYLEPQAIASVVNSGSNVVLTINNQEANFELPLDSGDEVIGNGKFVAV